MSIKRARQSEHQRQTDQTTQSINRDLHHVNKHGARSPSQVEQHDMGNQSVVVDAHNHPMYNNDLHNQTLNVS